MVPREKVEMIPREQIEKVIDGLNKTMTVNKNALIENTRWHMCFEDALVKAELDFSVNRPIEDIVLSVMVAGQAMAYRNAINGLESILRRLDDEKANKELEDIIDQFFGGGEK